VRPLADGEITVQVLSVRDDLGRVRFAAHWLDDDRWRGGNGVSAGVFHTHLGTWQRRHEEAGHTVRILTVQEGALLKGPAGLDLLLPEGER
jgi:hypothetical protein